MNFQSTFFSFRQTSWFSVFLFLCKFHYRCQISRALDFCGFVLSVFLFLKFFCIISVPIVGFSVSTLATVRMLEFSCVPSKISGRQVAVQIILSISPLLSLRIVQIFASVGGPSRVPKGLMVTWTLQAFDKMPRELPLQGMIDLSCHDLVASSWHGMHTSNTQFTIQVRVAHLPPRAHDKEAPSIQQRKGPNGLMLRIPMQGEYHYWCSEKVFGRPCPEQHDSVRGSAV